MIKDGIFVMPLRVYYADTDAGGVVYHANYLTMAERCRSEFLRHLDLPLIGENGENFVVKRSEIDWISPARLDDLLMCATRVAHVGAAKLVMSHNFEISGRDVCNINIELVYVSREMRPVKMGGLLRDKLGHLPTDTQGVA